MSLNQLELYENAAPDIVNAFMKNTESKLNVHIDISRKESNTQEWIDMMLKYMPYVLNALESPNVVMVTEEEVVKVESVKKITVETIKHLAKNTNLISEYNEDTGDVRPSKLLNSIKEEDYVTYENRFSYSLVRLMEDFIIYKTEKVLENNSSEKNIRKVDFEGESKVGKERVNIKTEICLDRSELQNNASSILKRKEQIKEIKEKINELKNTFIYKLINSKNLPMITSPLKMTNVLLKNANYQNATKLWNYLNINFKNVQVKFKEQKDYEDKSLLLNLYNESFLLNYLDFDIIKTKDDRDTASLVTERQMTKKITEMLMSRILDLNINMTETELKDMFTENFLELKKKYSANIKQIEDLYLESFDKFANKLSAKRVAMQKG